MRCEPIAGDWGLRGAALIHSGGAPCLQPRTMVYPIRVIQSISGHSSLEMLQRYLDVKDEQKRAAALAFG